MKIEFPEGQGGVSRFFTAILFKMIDFLDYKNDSLTTYRIKKLKLNKQVTQRVYDYRNIEEEIGIVIQGQIVSNTTIRICQRYRSIYPKVRIVFSTWDTESESDLSRIRNLNIAVIVNKLPPIAGPGNINLQILSTKAGIDFLREFSPKYILKNRSDCWLSSDYFLEYLHTLAKTYGGQQRRIVVPSYNSFLFRLYSPSDQIQFGAFEELNFFWECPQVGKPHEDFRFSESYLLRNMLLRQGYEIKYDIQDSLSIYRDKFIFADESQLGLVINKGTKNNPGNRWANDGYPQPWSEIQFWNWLELQQDISQAVSDYAALPEPPIS